jgi:phosphoglucomutase
MEVSGKIKVINETQTFGTSGFRKREVVITTNEQYVQSLLIEFTQDKCDLLNNYKVGDEVTIAVNLRGKEWLNPEGKKKYFNSINGWKIQKVNKEKSSNEFKPTPFEAMIDSNDIQDLLDLEETEDFPF